MRFTRFALAAGVVVVVAFMLLVAIGIHGALTPVIAIVALVGLIACGNLLYGKNSHGAAATARKRPAQEAQNRAIDEAQERARTEREQARQERDQARQRRGQARHQRAPAPPSPAPRTGEAGER
jgi:hypothetical protein